MSDDRPTTEDPFFAIRRTHGELIMGEYAWMKADGPDDWTSTEGYEWEDDPPEYEIVQMRPIVVARRTFGSVPCEACEGEGTVPDPTILDDDRKPREFPCKACDGSGKVPAETEARTWPLPAASGGADQGDADPFAALRALPEWGEWQSAKHAPKYRANALKAAARNLAERLDSLLDVARPDRGVLLGEGSSLAGAPSTDPAPEPGDAT